MAIDSLNDWKRTHDCGSLRKEDVDREVVLMGWVNRRRDLGKVTFIDLRDRSGLTQIVLDREFDETSHKKAGVLRNEWVIAVKGTVSTRLPGQENPELPTGDIEVKIRELKILNETDVPPFQVDGKIDASESLRLKYRYLELRRATLFHNIATRHQIALQIRNTLSREGFIEVETPFLTKSTPEGARDYLVPSRISKGRFYALPQSPQLFKQLLMVAGFDRYFQIVRCFRDEDLRADRQPEFTQVDMEMSFTKEDGVMDVVETLIVELFSSTLGYTLSRPFPRLEYKRAMDLYGSDKPDIRYGMELTDISDCLGSCGFKVFADVLDAGGVVKAINVKGGASLSRKDLDELNGMVVAWGARGLFWAKIKSDGWQSPLAKFVPANTRRAIEEKLGAAEGDLVIIVSDMLQVTNEALGSLRVEIGKKLHLVKPGTYSFVWITHFPLLEYSSDEERFVAVHHPFTAPLEEDLAFLAQEPERVRARSYDVVLNGQEIGGGSVRIHTLDLQNRIFRALGLGEQEVREKFGFFLDALTYGTPPHAGIALGFDRLVAIMVGAESLRDVIAFPKTQRATCAVTDAPSEVAENQLAELGLTLRNS